MPKPPPKKPVPQKTGHRPPHEPTKENRLMVQVMIAGGIEHIHIAGVLRISRPTLRKHYKHELATGAAEANASIVASLFKAAKGGNVKAAIWWTQARMGWSETQKVETTGPDGRPIEQVVTYRWAEPEK